MVKLLNLNSLGRRAQNKSENGADAVQGCKKSTSSLEKYKDFDSLNENDQDFYLALSAVDRVQLITDEEGVLRIVPQ